LESSFTEYFYAFPGREIHFQDDTTGILKIVGIRRNDNISNDSDILLIADEYPLVFVFKVLENLTKEPVSSIFRKKYEEALIKARRNLDKQQRFGRTFPRDI
jgi:hypothetical protein